ncbi:MAG: nucleotidyl transferase AbiEii/AbiGii toxin family protein [Lachnospiraceae bacterium]|nr:nucleotidyl transferase AbiEii/AbiGii toxin family protein [Lachnospiraceae bacterium]
MYLHNNRSLFEEIIEATAEKFGLSPAMIEKDYYVTMILKELNQRCENVVFKGGTSLSKCYKIINRFSEDIDITFSEHIGESRRKKLKYEVLGGLSKDLGMPIENWDRIRSKKNYNCYMFSYESVFSLDETLPTEIKLETALASYAFPTETKEVDSYVYQFLVGRDTNLIEQYGMEVFKMKVQSLERTFVDKVFALCDYYLQDKSLRYSRHLYDIHKLNPHIEKNASLRELVREVRRHRQGMRICPSAERGVNIQKLVYRFCTEEFYKEDYLKVTEYYLADNVSYDETINTICGIVDAGVFDE